MNNRHGFGHSEMCSVCSSTLSLLLVASEVHNSVIAESLVIQKSLQKQLICLLVCNFREQL